jgi:hypothetical protein
MDPTNGPTANVVGSPLHDGIEYRDSSVGAATRLWARPVVFNLGYAKTYYINQNETQEPIEP